MYLTNVFFYLLEMYLRQIIVLEKRYDMQKRQYIDWKKYRFCVETM